MEKYQTQIGSRLIAERTVPYRPQLKKLLGNTSSTILLQQINYWWHFNRQRAFYKFAAPCEHKQYRIGDSWQEELSFSRSELDTALKYIATKIQPKERFITPLMSVYDDGILAPVNRIVIYWRDRDNVTWYWLNEPLQELHLQASYADLFDTQNSDHLAFADVGIQHPSNAGMSHSGMTESSTTLYTESTKEDSETIPAAQRKRNPLFDAVVVWIWKTPLADKKAVDGISGRVGKVVSKIKDRATAEQIPAFVDWYRQEYPKAHIPRDADKFFDHWLDFEKSRNTASPAPVSNGTSPHRPAQLNALD